MALAHTQGAVGGGVLTGFLHPMKGPDHMLAMLAVGMWGAQLGSPCIWALPIAFPMIMALGGVLGILGLQIPVVEPVIAASVIVLGSLIALAARPPVFVATAVVGIFAIFHGYAHGAELPEGVGSLAYSLGFVVSTGLLHLTGILIGFVTKLPRGEKLLRTAGGLIGAAGLYLFTTMFMG
jgi:urease accessory protein